jgi:hypothetical protein
MGATSWLRPFCRETRRALGAPNRPASPCAFGVLEYDGLRRGAINENIDDSRGRTRFRIDDQVVAILDAEIGKMTKGGVMVPMHRRQMLRVMVARAARCKCGAQERELEGMDWTPTAMRKRRLIDADDLVAATVSVEMRKLAEDDDRLRVSFNRHQVLRVLLMRAARCTCPAG